MDQIMKISFNCPIQNFITICLLDFNYPPNMTNLAFACNKWS